MVQTYLKYKCALRLKIKLISKLLFHQIEYYFQAPKTGILDQTDNYNWEDV